MTYRFSQASERALRGVNPRLVAVARRALEISQVDFRVTEGLRSYRRQRQLYAAKATRTLNSKHLTGRAIDVAAFVGGTIRWDWPLYVQIADAFRKAARELDTPITWGGSWRTLKDGPHFELQD